MEIEEHEPKDSSTLLVDRFFSLSGSRNRLSQDGVVAEFTLYCDFKASNNEAKYEALITGLELAQELRLRCLRALSNS